jgi:hypothetical protein
MAGVMRWFSHLDYKTLPAPFVLKLPGLLRRAWNAARLFEVHRLRTGKALVVLRVPRRMQWIVGRRRDA